jgi:geranylgeranyl pyrophosphate synthase
LKYYSKRKELKEIKNIILKNEGIEYTNNKILEYTKKAKNEIQFFKDSKYKKLLIDMLDFNVARKF